MNDARTSPLSLAEKIDTLFRVWRRGGVEQTNDAVAQSIAAGGGSISAADIADLRSGVLGAVSTETLRRLAGHFGTDPEYLLSPDVGRIHDQLLLLGQLVDAGVKGVYLRGGIEQSELSTLLRTIRDRSDQDVA